MEFIVYIDINLQLASIKSANFHYELIKTCVCVWVCTVLREKEEGEEEEEWEEENQ